MPYDTRELLARLLQCEAGGEGINGMMAVATVIMNRANALTGEFARGSNGGDVRNIILQPSQFTCLLEFVDGVYNPQNIYNMNPQEEHFAIADWALQGGRFPDIGESLFFYSPKGGSCRNYFPTNVGVIYNRIGDHCFYTPTIFYHET